MGGVEEEDSGTVNIKNKNAKAFDQRKTYKLIR